MSRTNIPRTTPECEQLLSMVIVGVKSTPFQTDKKRAARVALKRLRRNRCVKSLEYVIRFTSECGPFDSFGQEIFDMATEYLNELS